MVHDALLPLGALIMFTLRGEMPFRNDFVAHRLHVHTVTMLPVT